MQPGALSLLEALSTAEQARQRPNRHHEAKSHKRNRANEGWSFKVRLVATMLRRLDKRKPRPNDERSAESKRQQGQKVLSKKKCLSKHNSFSRSEPVCPMLLVSGDSPSPDESGIQGGGYDSLHASRQCSAALFDVTSALPRFPLCRKAPARPSPLWRYPTNWLCSLSGGSFRRKRRPLYGDRPLYVLSAAHGCEDQPTNCQNKKDKDQKRPDLL